MNTGPQTAASRSCARPLVRFGEALKRAKWGSEGVSLERAHTPHTPRGRALKRRPGSLERVRSCAPASEQRVGPGVGPDVGPCRADRLGPITAAQPAQDAAGGPVCRVWGRGGVRAGSEGAIRYFAAGLGRLRRREQLRSPIEFVSPVRSGAAVDPRKDASGALVPLGTSERLRSDPTAHTNATLFFACSPRGQAAVRPRKDPS